MLEFYFLRVKMGKCSINQVPKKYRAEVKTMLEDIGYEFDEDGYIVV